MNAEKPYDLFARTRQFAEECRRFVRMLPKTSANAEDARQLIRSSGSVGANYIESRDALGKKDAIMRLRICRKEARESEYWISLFALEENSDMVAIRKTLQREAHELSFILTAILKKLNP